MPDYKTAMQGLQQVLEAIPQLGLDEREQALVAHLVERTAFNTHNALMAAQETLVSSPMAYLHLSTDLVMQMQKYSQLAYQLDTDGSIRKTIPIVR